MIDIIFLNLTVIDFICEKKKLFHGTVDSAYKDRRIRKNSKLWRLMTQKEIANEQN